MECRFCLKALKIEFALELERLEEAEAVGAAFIADCQDGDSYYQASAHQSLCRIAYARQDWKSLLAYAEEGEPLAKRLVYPNWQLEFQVCRALATFKLGDEKASEQIYLLAAAGSRRNKDNPSTFFYNVLSSYLEAVGKAEEALRLRQQQLQELQGSGQLTEEVRCRVEICRQLAGKSRLERYDLEAARERACMLANPTPYLAKLDELQHKTSKVKDQ
jgi:hypothetical protein